MRSPLPRPRPDRSHQGRISCRKTGRILSHLGGYQVEHGRQLDLYHRAEDLDQPGAYLIMAYVEWGEVSKHPGDPYILIVRTPGYDTAAYLSTPAPGPSMQ